MKLKQIQLQGFKSFCDRTVMNFPDAITCIVGPNGCGKSNVVDAIRWVLGEQSSKQLRGGQMEDVIFHGTHEIPAVGMAEVTLVFDNSAGLCPPDYLNFPEIQVTRRLFRSGESEYYINRTQCRLRDITDLFLGSGVGTKAYSIVEQGSIEQIITMKPEQRRTLIEEAAGVSKYRVRRQEALRKMEATRGNLVRLRDIIAELTRQMNSLNRQAKKAERFKEYKAELKEIELELAGYRARVIVADRRTSETKLVKLQEQETEAGTRREWAEAELEKGRAELLELERALSAARQRVSEAGREVDRHDRTRAMIVQELGSLDRNLTRLAEEREEMSARDQAMTAEIEGLYAEEDGLKADVSAAEDENRCTDEERSAKERELRENREAAAVLEQHVQGLAAEIAKQKSRVEWGVRQAAEMEDRKAALASRKDRLEQALEDQARANLTFNEKLYQLKRDAAELRKHITELEEELDKKKTEAAVSADRLAAVSSRLTHAGSRLLSLEEMERNFEGYERGVKAIMERKARLAAQGQNGIYDLVAEVVKTEPQYELALTALLGERLQAVVVRDRRRGLENIEYLREKGEGRSSFMPFEGVRASGPRVPEALAEIGAEPLAERISAPGEYAPLVQALVGDALVVGDLERALSVREEIGASNPLVTREGVLIDRLGVMTGGSVDSYPGFLAKKREAEELRAEVATLAEEKSRIETELAETRKAISELESWIAKHKEKYLRLDIEKNNIDKDLRQGADTYNNLTAEATAVAGELAGLIEAQAKAEQESAEARAGVERDEQARARVLEDLERRREDLARMQSERDECRQRSSAVRARLAALTGKIEAHHRHLERLKQAQEEVSRGLEKRGREQTESEERRAELNVQLEEVEGAKQRAVEAAKEVEDIALTARGDYERRAAELRESETSVKQLYRRREELSAERMECELHLTQLHHDWDKVSESISDKYGVELAEIMNEGAERFGEDYDPAPRQGRREELREKLERMGDVNPTALEEYQEISERHSFLTNQEGDLLTALENLELTIAKINTTYRRDFKITFDQVNAQFQVIFPRLFNGGQGSLALIDPENVLESGVDILAQPPGKKMNSIVLLSGGEKALTATALIISLFLVKPSPFCLLDEVDAALDEVNVGRFTDLVKDLSKDSQLLIITHNKKTMALGHTLYGVTMEKKGISRIVSVRLKKAQEMVDGPPKAGNGASNEAPANT